MAKILYVAHAWAGRHNAGAEFYGHAMLKHFLSHGHEVRVLLRQAMVKIKTIETYEGVEIWPTLSEKEAHGEKCLGWATHIITHLESTLWVMQTAPMFNKPVFFVSHNSWDYPVINQRDQGKKYPVGVIYNSHWMRSKLNYPQRSIVLHPPLDNNKAIQTRPEGDRITIINCNERKGGAIFKRIVKAMPNHKFLFVTGAYDEQITPDRPNAMCQPQTPDMTSVYQRTRVLLVPSAYESWSMACSEAMANGIPVICSPTPGLIENAGSAGIFIDSTRMQAWMKAHEPPKDMTDMEAITKFSTTDQTPAMDVLTDEDIAMWVEQIKALDDETNYFRASQKVLARSKEFDSEKELDDVMEFICSESST